MSKNYIKESAQFNCVFEEAIKCCQTYLCLLYQLYGKSAPSSHVDIGAIELYIHHVHALCSSLSLWSIIARVKNKKG